MIPNNLFPKNLICIKSFFDMLTEGKKYPELHFEDQKYREKRRVYIYLGQRRRI